MDSSGNNQSPWAPYDTYKDCSRGICSIYCPQWCYIIFPPPPPSSGDAGSDTYFSPVVIAVIGLLASAFLMVSYYTIITKYCRRRRIRGGSDNHISDLGDVDGNQMAWQNAAMGLDEAVIKSITVCKYRRGDGLIEGTDCSVCLSEFQEDESLRLLPKCNHAFHLPCIDTWLKSHSTCPLCRSNIVYNAETPPRTSPRAPQSPITAVETPLGANINDPPSVRRAETVVVIDDDDSRTAVCDEASVIAIAVDVPDSVASSKTLSCVPRSAEDRRTSEFVGQDDCVQRMRRSFSLDSSFSRGGAGASWSYNEEEEVGDSIQTENNRQISTGSGSSAPCDGEDSNSNHGTKGVPQPQVDKPTPPDMRRSLSIPRSEGMGKPELILCSPIEISQMNSFPL